MRATDISNALEARLNMAPSLGLIVWENKDAAPPPAPYLIFENIRTGSDDPTLGGGALTVSGYVMISVVHRQDEFATVATALADDVAVRFPYGLRLSVVGGGHLILTKPPFIGRGYNDLVNFRVPVRIEYEAVGDSLFANNPPVVGGVAISQDPGNILDQGTDGGLYVPPDDFGSIDLGTFN